MTSEIYFIFEYDIGRDFLYIDYYTSKYNKGKLTLHREDIISFEKCYKKNDIEMNEGSYMSYGISITLKDIDIPHTFYYVSKCKNYTDKHIDGLYEDLTKLTK